MRYYPHMMNGFWLPQVIGLVVMILLTVLAVVALLNLRKRVMSDTAQVLWTMLVLLVPFCGPIAYFIVRPGTYVEPVVMAPPPVETRPE
ncbi:MAG: PLDc_N domain-containing protein [Anaerolineaceae bacterium]|nr:PLDc_N domain-containing protein [Anaerolineaceae bacterium]